MSFPSPPPSPPLQAPPPGRAGGGGREKVFIHDIFFESHLPASSLLLQSRWFPTFLIHPGSYLLFLLLVSINISVYFFSDLPILPQARHSKFRRISGPA